MMKGKSRHYVISLYRTGSIMAFFACLDAVFFSLYGIVYGLIVYTRNGVRPVELFRFFTVDANSFMAFSAGMLMPFAVEGIRKKRFTCPRWVNILYYAGASYAALVSFVSTCVISWFDPEMAFGGGNFFLHVVGPAMIFISFFLIESDIRHRIQDSLVCQIPVLIYMAVYYVNVVVIGPENGGWEDMYSATSFMPAPVAALLLFMISFGISFAIGQISNWLSARRRKKLEEGLWDKDVDPVEIKVELFGLGRYMGRYDRSGIAVIPLDIIDLISKKYGIRREELIKPYTKGVLDSMDDYLRRRE